MRQSELEARAGADSVARAIGGRVRQGRAAGAGPWTSWPSARASAAGCWSASSRARLTRASRRCCSSVTRSASGCPRWWIWTARPGCGSPGPAPPRCCGGASSAGRPCSSPAPSRRTSPSCGTGRSGRARVTPARRTRREPASCSSSLTARSSSEWASTPRYSRPETRRRSPVTCPTDTSNASSAQMARFALTVFEPGVRPGITIGGYRCLMRAMLEDVPRRRRVDAAVFALRPDYRVLLLAVDGLVPGPGDQVSDALLPAAETAAREALDGRAGGAAAARRRLAGGLPGVRRQAAAHPQQPGGAAAPGRTSGLPRVEPAHRLLQRGLGAAPDPARRGGPDPLHRPAAAGPRHRRRAFRHRGRRQSR